MKTISSAVLTLIAACLMVHGSGFAPFFVPSTASREALRDLPGEAARLLGEALDSRPTSDNIREIRRHSVALVRDGHAKEVIALLQHPNPVASQGLLEGLLEADCREALPVFLDCLWDLEFYGMMTDDDGAYRDRIKDHLKVELARMMDLKKDPAWNRREFFERISERAGVPVSAERQAAMVEVCPVGSGGGKPPAPPPVLPGADEVAAPQRSLALWIFSAATVVAGGAVWWWWRRRRNAGGAF